MTRTDELRLLSKVARLYYEQGRRQSEIASQLDLSQATVSRLLKRAEEEQIVRITVSVPYGVYADLEEALQRTYGLKEAIVVDTVDTDGGDQLLRDLGAAAAFYVETTLKPREVVGISSWSATLLAMANAMQPLSRPGEARVVQILGGVGDPAAEGHAVHLTRRLATLIRGEATFLPAPGITGSAEASRHFLDDPFVQEAMALYDQVSLALVGIGALEPSTLLARSGNVFAPQEMDVLRAQGAVGDICLRFFDAAGNLVVTSLDERVIGMQLEQLRRVPRAVGIAGGRKKLSAIRGALRGRWINVLITDRFTAAQLVQASSDDASAEPSKELSSTATGVLGP
jgi:DNA-binding transcriptional regulator LsrR (DeoR family)